MEQKLAEADYGEDYIKSNFVDELKSQHELWTVLDADFKVLKHAITYFN